MTDVIGHLEAAVAEAVVALRQITPGRDWIDQLVDSDGDALKSDEAGFVAGVHPDTMRRRAEAAALTINPIAVLMAGALWLFSERRILASIEIREGLPARLAAETRAKKSRDLRAPSDISPSIPIAAAS
jgi:hypothetical protein